MSREVEDRVDAIAARQNGVVTRAQLIEAGLSKWVVGHRVRAGRFRPLHRGVYLVGPIATARTLELAAVLAGGPSAVLSHVSAAPHWEMIPFSERSSRGFEPMDPTRALGRSGRRSEDVVHILVTEGNRGRRPGIRVHRVARLEPDERTIRDHIPITTPGRTLVDLAGMLGSGELERAVARAERAGLLDRDALSRLVRRYPARRGIDMLRTILERQGGPSLTRSEAEARFLELVRKARLPAPDTNVKIGRYEIDFYWRAQRVAVEVDGYRYHASRRRFERDRRKDGWLLSQGITTMRLSWGQLVDDGMATVAQVAQALARSGTDAAAGPRPR
jgi:very-short-patch-repair endonuclease